MSIVLPTYNGAKVLPYTLQMFQEQIERNSEVVEFVICNNASTDSTLETLKAIQNVSPFFEIVDYKEYVTGGENICRSVDNANGKYVLYWGDDDIPFPMLVDYILTLLKKYPDIGYININKIRGFMSEIGSIHKMFLDVTSLSNGEVYFEDYQKFIEKYLGEMTFMSSNVFLRDEYLNHGKSIYNDKVMGYEWLGPMIYSIKGQKCLRVEYPLLIQSHPSGALNMHPCVDAWPLYSMVGIPRMLIMLQDLGVVRDWQKCFDSFKHNTAEEFRYSFNIMIKNRNYYDDYLEELISYQSDLNRKTLIRNTMRAGVKGACWRFIYYLKGCDPCKNVSLSNFRKVIFEFLSSKILWSN